MAGDVLVRTCDDLMQLHGEQWVNELEHLLVLFGLRPSLEGEGGVQLLADLGLQRLRYGKQVQEVAGLPLRRVQMQTMKCDC